MIEQIEPNKDVLRVVEKCIDVLLTAHEENWKTARLVAEGLSMPQIIVRNEKECADCYRSTQGDPLGRLPCPRHTLPVARSERQPTKQEGK